MKTRTIAILVATALLLVGGMFAVAQRMVGKDFAGHRGSGTTMFRQLELTDDQQSKVKDILEAGRSTTQPILEAMKANHEKLAALDGNSDEAAQVSAIAKEQGDLTTRMIMARESVKSQIFAVLTDEQKTKAAQLHEAMKQRFENRMKSLGDKSEAGEGAEMDE